MHGLFRWSGKWWPGIIPLVIFWAIAAWTSTEPLEADLAQRSGAALKDSKTVVRLESALMEQLRT